jgi:hypothetical protein
MQVMSLPLLSQEPSDGGRTHLEEELPCLLINSEMPMADEVLHKKRDASCQTARLET